MGIETAMALGAEQMRNTNVALAQDQVQVRVHAFRTGFTDDPEGRQIYWHMLVVGLVNDGARIQFFKKEAVIGGPGAAAMDRMGRGCVGRRCFKGLQAHSIDSLCFQLR
jgi:hypothetical protein